MPAPGAPDFGAYRRIDGESLLRRPAEASPDVEMASPDALCRLIIAFDFGTTFSSVAYAGITESMRDTGLGLSDIRCVARYPGDRPAAYVNQAWVPREDVPSEIWYSDTAAGRREQIKDPQVKSRPLQSEEVPVIDPESDSGSELSISPSDNEADGSLSQAEENEPKNRLGQRPYWGYEVQQQLYMSDIPKDNLGRLTRFKLMLSQDERTARVRADLGRTFRALKRQKYIKNQTDVIAAYLLELFLHTKDQLQAGNFFTDQVPVEFVLCIPAVWPAKACRAMQVAMNAAAEQTGLRNSLNTGMSDLFIVSEPEAAAACILEETQEAIFKGDIVVIIDAGGGTIDAVTYEVAGSYPLRLSREAVPTGTGLYGSSFINERFEELLLDKLKDEKYLIKSMKTIKSIVEAKVIEFENDEKRLIDTTDSRCEMKPVRIDDLKPNPAKNFQANRLEITRAEMEKLFRESLQGASKILKGQLSAAKKSKKSVQQKVILIGGFGNSPALQSYLKRVLRHERNFDGGEIGLLLPQVPSTAVAKGAILRAYNKVDGPVRMTNCSYGFYSTEPYDPDIPAHQKTRADIDKVDGERYVKGTIRWLIKKGDILKHRTEVSLLVRHSFPKDRKYFYCPETLYVSDEVQESHYRRSHQMNKAAERAGSIVADMTFLRTEGHIQKVQPTVHSTFPGGNPKYEYWEVEFDLVMIIEGRNLRYEARWPPTRDLVGSAQQQTVKQGQICIAAAFNPGTE